MFHCNKLYRLIGVFCAVFWSQLAIGQIPDSVVTAIKTVLRDKEVSEKVFFKYENKSLSYGNLGPGFFAFIYPDTTFQKSYKGIADKLPYWDSITYKIKFYKDQSGVVFIDGIVQFELVIVFQEINVAFDAAEISFFTTSSPEQERFKHRYVQVTAILKKVRGEWEVSKCRIKTIKWINYLE